VEATPPPDSTPKKLLFWENRGNETQRLEEELMTTRIREMEVLTELKELRLKVMELETQVRGRTMGCGSGLAAVRHILFGDWLRGQRVGWYPVLARLPAIQTECFVATSSCLK
jgi:hypothetical protein